MHRTAFAVALAISCAAPPASAAGPSESEMAGHMEDWFDGERNEAFVFLGAGVLSLGGGIYLATREDDLARGAGWPVAIVGGLMTIFSITYTLSLSPKHDELKEQLAKDPAGYKRDETERMEGIADRFVLYRWAEIAILTTGAGLITYGLVDDNDLVTGIGIGLAGEAALALTLDYFAERRTHEYLDHLHAFQPATSSQPLSSGRTFMLGYGGSF